MLYRRPTQPSTLRRLSREAPLALMGSLLLTACTSVVVKPLAPGLDVSKVCIEENEKVTVPGFVEILRRGFDRHGISTEVFPGKADGSCKVVLTYTALRSWDLSTYLSRAELWLRDSDGRLVASAEYYLRGKGGFALTKFASAQSKMDPVIDELLVGYMGPDGKPAEAAVRKVDRPWRNKERKKWRDR